MIRTGVRSLSRLRQTAEAVDRRYSVNCRDTREIGGDPPVLNLGIEPFSPFRNSKGRTSSGQRNGPVLLLLQSPLAMMERRTSPPGKHTAACARERGLALR